MKQSGILFTGKKIIKSLALAVLLLPALSFSADYDKAAEAAKKKLEILNVSCLQVQKYF